MVTEWGMSEKLGMIAYGENSQEVFLGHSVTQSKNLSEETARQIDGEIRRIIDEAYAKAKQLLSENIDELHLLAERFALRRNGRSPRTARQFISQQLAERYGNA